LNTAKKLSHDSQSVAGPRLEPRTSRIQTTKLTTNASRYVRFENTVEDNLKRWANHVVRVIEDMWTETAWTNAR
jgi:hypothetical protein